METKLEVSKYPDHLVNVGIMCLLLNKLEASTVSTLKANLRGDIAGLTWDIRVSVNSLMVNGIYWKV